MAAPYALLINPNSSQTTSEMMLDIARRVADGRVNMEVATATRNPTMIVTYEQLQASAKQVIEIATECATQCVGVIVSAFGDPGAATLKQNLSVPVIGICEASMLEASRGGRKFAVATVTPDLIEAIDRRAHQLGLSELFMGTYCTAGDPEILANDPSRLPKELGKTVRICIDAGAEAVIIGGGPLGQAAETLQPMFEIPIIAPISSAVQQLINMLDDSKSFSRAYRNNN